MNNKKLIGFSLFFLFACHKSNINEKDRRNFDQVNLVANSDEYHPVTKDPTLHNAFGIAWTPSGLAWVNLHIEYSMGHNPGSGQFFG